MAKAVSVLLTGVGAPGTRGTVYALRKNPDGTSVKIYGTDIKKDVVGRAWTSAFHIVPQPEDDGYVDEMNRLCGLHGIDVVVPQTTRETVALSVKGGRLDAPVTVSKSSTIRKANDKFELLRVFEKLGLPHPRAFLVSSAGELEKRCRQMGYPGAPVVVKPPVSFGSRGFRVLREGSTWTRERFLREKPGAIEVTLGDLVSTLERGKGPFPRLLVSEFMPGPEYSVDAFIGKKGKVAIARRRDEILNGISFRATLDGRKDVEGYTLKAAGSLGLRFAFGFQYRLDEDGVPKVLECNPRVQGTMVASVFSGVNVIWMAVREATGKPVSVPTRTRGEVSFVRFWGGVGLRDGRILDEI